MRSAGKYERADGAGDAKQDNEMGATCKSWRDVAKPIIAKVLLQTEGAPEQEIKKALFDAYPWGERRMYPYKIWLSEIRRQRGIEARKILDGKDADSKEVGQQQIDF